MDWLKKEWLKQNYYPLFTYLPNLFLLWFAIQVASPVKFYLLFIINILFTCYKSNIHTQISLFYSHSWLLFPPLNSYCTIVYAMLFIMSWYVGFTNIYLFNVCLSTHLSLFLKMFHLKFYLKHVHKQFHVCAISSSWNNERYICDSIFFHVSLRNVLSVLIYLKIWSVVNLLMLYA